jgi:transcription initiation factor TFIID TATA-box-binding protein
MQGRVTVFLSGKMISTGAKSVLQSIQQLEYTMDLLVNGKFVKREQLEPKVRNIVAVMDIRRKLDISQLSQELSKMIYEPEQFPGAVYRTKEGQLVLSLSQEK